MSGTLAFLNKATFRLCGWRCARVTVPSRSNSQHRVVLIPEVPTDTAQTNPLLTHYSSGKLPALSQVSERHAYFGLGKALLEYEAMMAQVEQLAESGIRDFQQLLEPLEKAKCQFESVWHCANMLQLVQDSVEKDRYSRLHVRAERASLSRVDSRPFFEALKEMKANHVEKGGVLTPDQERIVDRYLLEYKHNGYELSENKYLELTENWLKRVSENVVEYKFRYDRSTERFKHTIRDPNVVRDFPIDVLKAMATDSSQPTKGPWVVTLHPYIQRQVMSYCPDRNVRWNTHLGDVQRGGKTQDIYLAVQNHVKLIRQYRFDQAITLGYNNFAEFSMETKMAGSIENVQTMISTLQNKAKPHQEIELENLQAFAESRGFDDDIEVFDVDYFKRKQKRSLLGVSDEDLRDFFPLPKVMDGIFQLCSSMFSVGFEEVKGAEVEMSIWHPEVKVYRAIDLTPGANNRVLGEFYLDLYIRDDKGYAGGDKGWYIPVRSHSRMGQCRPLGSLIMSLPVPNYGKPSLLNMSEVEELLRNFGNLLFHMCSTNSDYSDLCGKGGLEWDVLDLPGYFMTHWLYLPEVLQLFSGHWSSNQPLEPKVISKLCTVPRQLLAGYKLCNDLYKASYDLAFYSEDYNKEAYQDIVKRIRQDFLLLPEVQGDVFPLYVSEMLSGDYPGAMFCSTWAKMLAADAFSAVQEVMPDNDSLLESDQVKKVTARYRNTILSSGSSKPFAETFRLFRGRDPSHEALLLTLGLKATQHPKKKGQESVV